MVAVWLVAQQLLLKQRHPQRPLQHRPGGYDRGEVHGRAGGERRRAMGFKRSEKRMKEIETKLREGMDRNGIRGAVQDQIVLSITSLRCTDFRNRMRPVSP